MVGSLGLAIFFKTALNDSEIKLQAKGEEKLYFLKMTNHFQNHLYLLIQNINIRHMELSHFKCSVKDVYLLMFMCCKVI